MPEILTVELLGSSRLWLLATWQDSPRTSWLPSGLRSGPCFLGFDSRVKRGKLTCRESHGSSG